MKNKISKFLNKTFFIFGIIIFFLTLESFVVGENAKKVTSIFAQSGYGLNSNVILEFLGLSMVIVIFDLFLFSEKVLIGISITLRLSIMIFLSFLSALIFVFMFKWFDSYSLISWIYFLLCFVISCSISVFLTMSKEKKENQKLEEALRKYKSKIDKENIK